MAVAVLKIYVMGGDRLKGILSSTQSNESNKKVRCSFSYLVQTPTTTAFSRHSLATSLRRIG